MEEPTAYRISPNAWAYLTIFRQVVQLYPPQHLVVILHSSQTALKCHKSPAVARRPTTCAVQVHSRSLGGKVRRAAPVGAALSLLGGFSMLCPKCRRGDPGRLKYLLLLRPSNPPAGATAQKAPKWLWQCLQTHRQAPDTPLGHGKGRKILGRYATKRPPRKPSKSWQVSLSAMPLT